MGSDRGHDDHRVQLATLVVLIAGLVLSVLAAWSTARHNAGELDRRFELQAQRLANRLAQRLATYEYGLRGARGALQAAGEKGITPAMFRTYMASRDLAREFPGARGFGFIRRTVDGRPDPPAPRDGGDPAAARASDERWVIELIEPLESNQEALGLDIAAEPRRHEAAAAAMRTGQATLTAPITLVQATSAGPQGFLLLLPIYRTGLPGDSPAQRMAAGLGWAYTPIVASEVLAGFDELVDGLAMTLSDVSVAGPAERFHGAPAAQGELARTLERELFGRRWQVHVEALPKFVDSLNLVSPRQVFVGGALTTLLAAALTAAVLANRRREWRLRAQQAQLSTIVENSSDAIVGETPEGVITSWNPAAERLFGWSAADALGRRTVSLIVPDDLHAEEAARRARVLQGQALPGIDLSYRAADGRRIDVSETVSPLRAPDGRLVGIARSLRDVADRKAAEAAQRDFHARLERLVQERSAQVARASHDLETVLDATPALIAYWDRDLRLGFANQAYHAEFGAPPGSLRGLRPEDFQPPELVADTRPHMLAALRGESQSFERADLRYDGRRQHLVVHYRPDVGEAGVRGFYVLVHDVTELVESRIALTRERQRLAESEAFLERAGRVAGIGGWQLELATHRLEWSAQTRRIHEVEDGYTPTLDESLGFYVAGARETMRQALRAATERGQGWDLELPIHTAAGRAVWVRTIGEAEYGDDGGERPARIVGALQDITAQRIADQALMRVEAAEAANAAKTRFLANMSHEIRTPMNAVVGLTRLLAETALDAEQRRLVDRIQLASRTLLGLITDVLDLSKIESGAMTIEHVDFDLATLVRELGELFDLPATTKGLTLVWPDLARLPRRLRGDPTRVRQILVNLLGNAIKFTAQGRVALVVEALDTRPDRVRLRLTVVDTGIGIAAPVLAQLWQPFTQADASTTRRFGGSGLGLSIVRHLAELMNGQAGASSRPGIGSSFWVELPFELVTGRAAEPQRVELRLAVTDAARRGALESQARALGWRVSVDDGRSDDLPEAAPAEAGVDRETRCIVRLVDHHPGPERGDRPAGDPPARSLPTVVTGDTPAGQEAPRPEIVRLRPGGGVVDLLAAVHAAVHQVGGDTDRVLALTDAAAVDAAWLDGLHVVIVDDSEVNLEVAQRLLQSMGARVTAFDDAAAALQRLRAEPAGVDAVLMDVQMPGLDGREATRRLRATPALAGLPVIALTAGTLVVERQRALDAGMDDFVSKPLDPVQLMRSIRRLVQARRTAPLPIVRRPARAASAGQRRALEQVSQIDLADARARLGHDDALLWRLVTRLLRDVVDLVGTAPPADGAARERLRARMHKLRGSAGTVGLRQVAQAAADAEAALRDPGADAGPAWSALSTALAGLRDELAPWLDDAPSVLPVTSVAGPAAAAGLQDRQLRDIDDLLCKHDLAALTAIEALREPLAAHLGPERWQAFRTAVDELEFARASRLLQGEAVAI